ncbi:DUF3833 domain-containing protein [Rhodosalinus halophilus]|uniref:DUF3833 domain-containing protein n=1 Tax=Rhodosalinus halophilus TaxID=2259333 RepID=A0A365UA21_9RHOB|nr:DUF3833 family protein [Rhodosalinus halophilus]RBI85581.1 DUF3833 domain-containing protein [Rhodosalinus halophilus]
MENLIYALTGAAAMAVLVWLRTRFFGFLAQSPGDYGAGGPQFDIRRHLDGPLVCDGVIYGPTGRVASRFKGDFDITWQGNTGVMRERFEYDSGAVQHRAWHLTIGNDGRIRAQAEDVVGDGEGWQKGSAVQLKYRIRLPEESGGHVLDTTDWMYLTPAGTIVNRSQFRKYGIKVAELVATMRRKDAA